MNINLNLLSSITRNDSLSLFNGVGTWIRRVSPLQVGIAIGITAIVAVLAVKLFYYIQQAFSTPRSKNPAQKSDVVNFKQENVDPLPQGIASPFKVANRDNQSQQLSQSPKNSNSQVAKTSPDNAAAEKAALTNEPAQQADDPNSQVAKTSPDNAAAEKTALTDEHLSQPNDDPNSQVAKDSPLVEEDLTQPIIAKTLISKSISPKEIKNLQAALRFLDNPKEIGRLKIVLPPASFGERTIKEDIFKIIAQTCPNLERLAIIADEEQGFPVYLSEGFKSLSELSKLKTLEMMNLSAENLAISLNKSLEALYIDRCIFSHFPKEIKNLENLHKLVLSENLFDKNLANDDLAKEYSDILTGLKGSLVDVHLLDWRLRTLPAAFVGDAFKEFVKLELLNLYGNPLIEKPDFSLKQVHQDIRFDDDYSAPAKALPGQNVMIIGRSRSGKSTLMNVLANKFETKFSSIFSESKGSSLKTITIPDILIDGKPAQINIHDTPGLFEVRPAGEKERTNEDILNLIYDDSNAFFGQKSLENIHHIILTFAPTVGISQEDMDSMLIALPFLYRMGLPSTTKILMVITHAESSSKIYRDQIINQLNQHPIMSKIISEYKAEILYSGAKDIDARQSTQESQEQKVIVYRDILLSKLLKDIPVEDVAETEISNEINGDIYS